MSLERIGRKKADNGTYRDIFSAKEIRSLLYYQNAGKNIVLSDNEKHLEKFYAIENAYEVTSIFLQYDELRMKWEFEKVKDPERLNEYIQRMLDISILDNELCKMCNSICIEH